MNDCCYIDSKTNRGCEARAELLIISGHAPDDYTHACPQHVEDLMVDGLFNHVYPLQRMVEELAPTVAQVKPRYL